MIKFSTIYLRTNQRLEDTSLAMRVVNYDFEIITNLSTMEKKNTDILFARDSRTSFSWR